MRDERKKDWLVARKKKVAVIIVRPLATIVHNRAIYRRNYTAIPVELLTETKLFQITHFLDLE